MEQITKSLQNMNYKIKWLVFYPIIGGVVSIIISKIPFADIFVMPFLLLGFFIISMVLPLQFMENINNMFMKNSEHVNYGFAWIEYLTIESLLFFFLLYTLGIFVMCFIIYLVKRLFYNSNETESIVKDY